MKIQNTIAEIIKDIKSQPYSAACYKTRENGYTISFIERLDGITSSKVEEIRDNVRFQSKRGSPYVVFLIVQFPGKENFIFYGGTSHTHLLQMEYYERNKDKINILRGGELRYLKEFVFSLDKTGHYHQEMNLVGSSKEEVDDLNSIAADFLIDYAELGSMKEVDKALGYKDKSESEDEAFNRIVEKILNPRRVSIIDLNDSLKKVFDVYRESSTKTLSQAVPENGQVRSRHSSPNAKESSIHNTSLGLIERTKKPEIDWLEWFKNNCLCCFGQERIHPASPSR